MMGRETIVLVMLSARSAPSMLGSGSLHRTSAALQAGF